MRQHGQGAGTANDGQKGRGWEGQHERNHIATRYREKREDLRSRERELNKREPESKKPESNAYRKKGGDSKIVSSGRQTQLGRTKDKSNRLRGGERSSRERGREAAETRRSSRTETTKKDGSRMEMQKKNCSTEQGQGEKDKKETKHRVERDGQGTRERWRTKDYNALQHKGNEK